VLQQQTSLTMTEQAVASPKRAAIKTAPRVNFDLDADIPFNNDTLTGGCAAQCIDTYALIVHIKSVSARQALTDEIFVLPNWRCDAGKLANGMTYYCRQNSQPRNRAELRVAIKVGSLQESEHERGIAHLIEVSVHMFITTAE
jgi:Insulinase (Peptidase family M16)